MTSPRTKTELRFDDWRAEGERRFGPDRERWKFECPACGHVAAWADWAEVGADEGSVAFACVGRWIPGSRSAMFAEGPGPCDYTGGGLFKLNPLRVSKDGESTTFFAFAEAC